MIEKYNDITEDALLRVRDVVGYVTCDKLTKEQLNQLQILNLHLLEYEKEIKKQVQKLIQYSQNLEQFDGIEVAMNFYLAKDDPCYKDDCDNLLVTMIQNFYSDMEIYGIDDGQNHSEFTHWDEKIMIDGKKHVMYGDYHCWTFHSLYDHTQLQWEEILRIGSIDINLKLRMSNSLKDVPKRASL